MFTFWDIHPAQYTPVGGWRLWKLFTFIFSPTTPSTYHIYYLNNQFQHSLLLSLSLTQFFMRMLLRTELLENNNILSSLDRKKNELKRSKYGAAYVFLEFSSYFNSYAVRVISSTLLSLCVFVFFFHLSCCTEACVPFFLYCFRIMWTFQVTDSTTTHCLMCVMMLTTIVLIIASIAIIL